MKAIIKKGHSLVRDGKVFHAGDTIYITDEEAKTLSPFVFITDEKVDKKKRGRGKSKKK